MKRIFKIICFQIGVNVIGLLDFHKVTFDLTKYPKLEKKHHR